MSTIESISQYGYAYLVPSICVFGILCNIINLTVLLNRRLKESPYTYLTCLATFDILTLLFTLSLTFTRSQSIWFSYKIGLKHEYINSKLEKKFFLPTANLFSPMSSLITVVLTVERFFFTKFPMKATSFCVPEYARRIMFILFICVFIFRIPVYLFYDIKLELNSTTSNSSSNSKYIRFTDMDDLCVNSSTCKISIENYYKNFQNFYYIFSFVVFQIIPAFLLAILNVSLIIMVRKAYNKSKELQKSDILKNIYQEETADLTDRRLSVTSMNTNKHLILPPRKSIVENRARLLSIQQNFQNKVKDTKRLRDQVKLTRTLIAVICFALVSEIVSIITYDRITEFLIGRYYENYMLSGYKMQRLISNTIVCISHSVNFFLYCAFNTRYLDVLKFTYSFLLRRLHPTASVRWSINNNSNNS